MQIILIRHAECIGNIKKALTGRTDFALTSKGFEMAKKVPEYLSQFQIDAIYSSPRRRCIDSVKPFADKIYMKINIEEDLREKDFGEYDGKTWEEIERINPKIIINKKKYNEIKGIKGQETTEEVTKRMTEIIKKIAEENFSKNVLICSHGCAIENFLRAIMGESLMDKKEEYSQKNLSINVLEYNNNQFAIKVLNKIIEE